MVLYKQLMVKHKDYDAQCLIKNELLYEGGIALSKQADVFLPRGEDEGDEFYQERLMTAFDPIFANTLDRFKSLLFSNPMSIVPSADKSGAPVPAASLSSTDAKLMDFIRLFEKNCDGQGTSFHNFCKETFSCALRHGHALAMVDFPRVDPSMRQNNLTDQLNAGELNGYLVEIPLTSLIDWQRDERGNFVWLKLFTATNHRDGAFSSLMCLNRWIEIKIENGTVVFHTYEKDINLDNGDKINDDDDIPELLPAVVTSFKTLNTVEMCLAPGLRLGNVIAPACEQLFRTDSFINAAAIRNTISFAVYKAGNNLSMPGADGRRAINTVQMNPNRFQSPSSVQKTNGWTVIGKDDSVEIVEAEGKAIATLQEQRKVIIERINAAVHQVAQNIQSRGVAQAQSAAAKQEDRRDTEIILNEFKLVVEQFAVNVIDLLLQLRQQQAVELHMEGLNVEDDVDRAELLKEVMAYGQFPDAPIFKINFEYNAALGLLSDDLSDDDKHELRNQIEESIKNRPTPAEMQMQQAGNKPMSSSGSSGPTDDAPMDLQDTLTGSGHPTMPKGAHLASGEHVDARVVYDQLTKDYKKKDIAFVLHIPWLDQSAVDLSDIDSSNKDNWQASQEPEKVDEFAQKIEDGFDKPIILVNNPSNNSKMQLVDGHHRFLAHLKLGQPVPAYIGQIGADRGPWDKLHSKQVGSKQEESEQKEVSNQVDASEEDK